VVVIGGSYDGSLHGWHDGALAFAYQAHDGCLRALAVSGSGRMLASGASDETVRVYDIVSRREVGELGGHVDDVSALSFVGDGILITGGRDGRLILWRSEDWESVGELKGHKDGPVTSIAVNPTGKVAFSTSNDNSLRMWNLETARSASSNKLAGFKRLDYVRWSRKGLIYVLVADEKTVLVFDVSNLTAEPKFKFEQPCRVNDLCFTGDRDGILVGLDSGELRLYDSKDGKLVKSMTCSGRIRGLGLVENSLYIALSKGEILRFSFDGETLPEKGEAEEILNVGSNAHVTCMACTNFKMNTKKREREPEGNHEVVQKKRGA